jgi:hypothetical protein
VGLFLFPGHHTGIFKNLEIKIYRTWTPTLREEHGLGVFQNRVLRRIFGPMREEVAGGWIRLYNESFIACMLQKILLK